MLYLIDGYNLLYAMGVLLRGQTGPAVLRRARSRLLALLHRTYGERGAAVTVVFDSKNSPPGVPAERDYQGIHVSFAVQDGEADDLIGHLIRRAATPRQLTVISDDHRIRQAARRRRCVVQGCGEYMDWLAGQQRPPPARPPEEAAKPDRLSGAETQRWLEAFAGLEDDPDLKELFDAPHRPEEGSGE